MQVDVQTNKSIGGVDSRHSDSKQPVKSSK